MTFYAGEFLSLPGLRAYWPMNAFDGSGNTIDQAGLDLGLSYNGNPGYNYTTQGAGYIDLDGTGDYLSRGDEASLDILGTETAVATAQRGLTVGGWFWFDTTGTQVMINKWNATGSQQSHLLYKTGGEVFEWVISSTGANTFTVTGLTAITTAAWFFGAARFTPSTEIAIFTNTNKVVNTTSIPAALFNSTTSFIIGARGDTTLLVNGRASNCFLSAMALSDTAISNLYNNTKAAYGL